MKEALAEVERLPEADQEIIGRQVLSHVEKLRADIDPGMQAGIKEMITAVNRELISPHVMIDAALHVLAAWVASSQTNSASDEREEEVDDFLEILPSYIEYHRTAGWLPEPRRSDH